MKLSIIVPAYNVEKYIECCLLSCVEQDVDYSSYEIIVVNDGSKDSTLLIAQRISKQYSNINVITQENAGLGMARNKGLELAKGDYVWFVDSDDSISPNCLGAIYSFFEKGLDILQIQYQYVYEGSGKIEDADKTIIEGVKNGVEIMKQGGLDIPAQFSIYRRGYLKEFDLHFYPKIYHEDTEFKPRALYFAKKVASYDNVVYNYLQREGSITSHKGIKHAKDLLTVSSNLIHFYSVVSNNEIRPYFAKIVSCNVNWLLKILDNLNDEERYTVKELLKESDYIVRFMLYADELRYRIEARSLLINVDFTKWAFCKIDRLRK